MRISLRFKRYPPSGHVAARQPPPCRARSMIQRAPRNASALPHKNEFARCQVLVGQALLPVHACCSDIELDRQECLSYPISSTVSQVWRAPN